VTDQIRHFLGLFGLTVSRGSLRLRVEVGSQERPMLDAVFVVVTIAFFVLSLGYVAGCERLK
jgi:hypothetical protein